ncbi:MAG: LPXTG cell wall anchor domain-containing protein [Atopobium sp.]|nr:LPXTG cell wall anchor domain-containing protein [Atopobium sp.]
MSKYLRNNIKLLAIAGIMAGVLVFSPVLSALALAEGTEAAEVSATTETTATTEAAAATTEAATTTETTAVATATDDDSDAEAVGSYMGADGIMREIHVSVSTDGGTYNGKDYIPPTISDDFKSVSFSSNVQREGYTLVGFSTGYFSQEEVNNATPDMSKPYTIDESGNVHMNLDDIVAWSITDNIDTNTITSLYHLTTLWAPNPEPEPEPTPEPEPQPAPTPVAPASDPVQQPAPRREKSVLPNTGDASSVAGVVAAAGTTLVALGLRKKMQQ